MNDPQDNISPEDKILYEAIRKQRKEAGSEIIRPADDAILHYKRGNANEEETKSVQDTMLKSSVFRAELLSMIKDIEEISDSHLEVDDSKLVKTPVPSLSEFLAEREAKNSTTSGNVRTSRIYLSLAAAAILIITFIGVQWFSSVPSSSVAEWTNVAQTVEPALLISNKSRAAGIDKIPMRYKSGQEAAMAAFRDALVFRDGLFVAGQTIPMSMQSDATRKRVVRLLDSAGEVIFIHTDYITKENEGIQMWALGLPERKLFFLDVVSDTTSVEWTKEMGTSICLTYTYQLSNDHLPVGARVFQLPDSE